MVLEVEHEQPKDSNVLNSSFSDMSNSLPITLGEIMNEMSPEPAPLWFMAIVFSALLVGLYAASQDYDRRQLNQIKESKPMSVSHFIALVVDGELQGSAPNPANLTVKNAASLLARAKALRAQGHTVYVAEVKGISDEVLVTIPLKN